MSTNQVIQDYINICHGDPKCYSKAGRDDARQAVQNEVDAGRTTWNAVDSNVQDVLCLVAQSDGGWGSPELGAAMWGLMLAVTVIGCISGVIYAIHVLITPIVQGVLK